MSNVFYNTKAASLFLKKQTTLGTFVQPTATDAIFTKVTPDLEPKKSTVDLDFLSGDPLTTENLTYVSDVTGELKIETPILRLKNGLTPDDPYTVSDVPHSILLEASGGTIIILTEATWGYPAGSVICSSVSPNNVVLSGDARKSSMQDIANQKSVTYKDLRATIDLSIKPNEIPTFTFNLKGEVLNEGVPTNETALDFQPQRGTCLPAVKPSTIQETVVYPAAKVETTNLGSLQGSGPTAYTALTLTITGHSFAAGNSVVLSGVNFIDSDNDGNVNEEINRDSILYSGPHTIASVTENTVTINIVDETGPQNLPAGNLVLYNITQGKAICFDSLTASNLFSYSLDRLVSSCFAGYLPSKTTTQVTCTVLEDKVGGDKFDPDANIEGYFALKIKLGNGTGKNITFLWNCLQLKSSEKAEVAMQAARQLTFQNDRYTYIIWN